MKNSSDRTFVQTITSSGSVSAGKWIESVPLVSNPIGMGTAFTVGVQTVTPGFKKLTKAQKESLPTNPLSWSKMKTIHPQGNHIFSRYDAKGALISVSRTSGVIDHMDNFGNPGHTIDKSKVMRRARNSTADKAKQVQLNLALIIAERGQTANLLAETLKSFVVRAQAIRRLNFTAAAAITKRYAEEGRWLYPGALVEGASRNKQLKSLRRLRRRALYHEKRTTKNLHRDISAAITEVQYGWRPLILDITEAAKMVEGIILDKPPVETARGVASEIQHSVTTQYTGSGWLTTTRFSTVICKSVAKFQIGGPVSSSLAKLGLDDLPSLAWETMPWSFVVDWAYPLGAYLGRISSYNTTAFVRGYETTYERSEITVEWRPDASKGYSGGWSGKRTFTSFSRSPIGSFPEVSLPSWKNPVSFEHLINAIALLKVNSNR